MVSAPSSRGFYCTFRWLRSPDYSQVARLGAAVAARQVGVGRQKARAVARESWCWAKCVALRLSLVTVQADGLSVLWGHG